jgi:putative inorganic carbon (HCO3(-)) transporter
VSASLTRTAPRAGPGALQWWVLALGASVVLARVTMSSPQLGCALALLVLAVGCHLRSRRAGLAVLWGIWLLAPLLRRLLGLETGYVGSDPLALLPFLVTLALVAIEVRMGGVPPPLRRPLLLGGAGLLIAAPMGLATAPTAAAFALIAYGAGLSALVLGYRDSTARDGAGSLLRAFAAAMPWLAGYAILQYFALPDWDRVWLQTTNFITAGSPEAGHVRVWSTLNSPGTFAMALGMALIAALAARRFGPLRALACAALVGALTLTYVRSAWVALAATGIVLLVASRGRLGPRLAVALAFAFLGIPALAAGSPTGTAIGERFGTFGQLGDDTSARERRQTTLSVIPQSIARPLGFGIGRAGEASRLSQQATFRNTDNSYLSLLYQLGPFGFALLAAAVAFGVRRAWRLARRTRSSPLALTLLGIAVFTLIGMLTGDLLYGVTGVAFWYVLGLAIREDERSTTTTQNGALIP